MIDQHSPTWRFVAEWVADQHADRMKRLKARQDEISTATLRGELRVLDALLSLPEQKPDPTEREYGGISPPEV